MFNKLCIIGVGLIGGSIAKAARHQQLAKTIVGLGRESGRKNLEKAKQLGVIDAFYFEPEAALKNADCVIIATPVGAFEAILIALKPYWSDNTIYSDAGSTKGSVIDALKTVFKQIPPNFVPAHPIAGAEKSGVEAALTDLYQNKRLILTPVAETDEKATAKMTEFWTKIGSNVVTMEVAHHDAVLAATSHLPHILAYSLVNLLGHKNEQEEIFNYAASGFKDFTRIASSDPTMWLDICMANKDEIMPLINQLCSELKNIENMMQDNKKQELFDSFSYAKQARQRFLDQLK